MTRRYGSPDWADTPEEADAHMDAIDRAHDQRADQRTEAQDADFTSTHPDHDSHWMCALANVQNGWRP